MLLNKTSQNSVSQFWQNPDLQSFNSEGHVVL